MITDATLDSSYEHLEQSNKESVYSIDKDNTSTLTSNHYQVTVEPVIFCYAFGRLLHVPIIQQYIYHCVGESKGLVTNKMEHHSNCDNHTAHDNLELQRIMKDIQSESSLILLATIVTATIPTLFMTLMLGSWSDNVGRRTVYLSRFRGCFYF